MCPQSSIPVRRELALIVLLGFVVRLAWILLVPSELINELDMRYYYSAASNLAQGRGLTVGFIAGVGEVPGAGGVQAVVFPPGYPLVLGAAFKVFGDGLVVGRLVNLIAGTLTIVAAYALNKSLFGSRTALLATALLALYPAHIFWTSVLYSETVFAFLFTVALWLVVSLSTHATMKHAFVLGIVVGAATTVRAPAAVLLPCAWLYLLRGSTLRLSRGGGGALSWGACSRDSFSCWVRSQFGTPSGRTAFCSFPITSATTFA